MEITFPLQQRMNRSNTKVMLVVFFWLEGVDSSPIRCTWSDTLYSREVLRRLRKEGHKKRSDSGVIIWQRAPAHTSFLVVDHLAKNNTTTLPYSPGAPDLTDFFLLPKLKASLKRRHFKTIEEIKKLRENSCAPFQKACSMNSSEFPEALHC